MGQIGVLDEMMPSGSYKLLEVIVTMCPNWLTTAESGGFLWTSERLFELGMDIGGRRKTRNVKGGLDTRCLLVFARVLFVLEMALCKLRCSNAPQLSVKSQFWISSLLR